MFQDKLVEKLFTKLNNNTQSVTFRGGYIIQTANEAFEFTTYTNYYTSTTTEYVPVMMTSSSRPKNIPNKDIYDWTFDITFAIVGESETENQAQRNAIDEFRQTLTNTPNDTVTNGTTTYNIVTTATDIAIISDTVVVNGRSRSLVSMQVYVQSGINVWYGNSVGYSIKRNGVTEDAIYLDILSTSDAKSKTLDSAFVFGSSTTSSVAIDGIYVFKGVVVYKNDDILNAIVEDILKGDNINYLYDFTIEYPNIAPITKTMLLSNGSINTSLGELITITLELVESE